MTFNDHRKLQGLHAAFSPSQPFWLRYDANKAVEVYENRKAAEYGTKLHAWAKSTIDLGIRQSRSKNTLCSYVNDAIGYQMNTEVVLYYSDRFFGTADAICFSKNFLRIHDLKTGKIQGKMEQLMIYAALFCLEYKVNPKDIQIELRIYQSNDILICNPEAEEIRDIMDHIIYLDKAISECVEDI